MAPRYEVWTGVQTTRLSRGEPYITYRGVLRCVDLRAAQRRADQEPCGTALIFDTETGEVTTPAAAPSALLAA